MYKFFNKVEFFAWGCFERSTSVQQLASSVWSCRAARMGSSLGSSSRRRLQKPYCTWCLLEVFGIWWLLSLYTTSIVRVALMRALFEKLEKLPPLIAVLGNDVLFGSSYSWSLEAGVPEGLCGSSAGAGCPIAFLVLSVWVHTHCAAMAARRPQRSQLRSAL